MSPVVLRSRTCVRDLLGILLILPERRSFRQFLSCGRYVGAFPLEKVGDRAPQARVVDLVRRVGRGREIAARNLVLALGASFYPGEPMRDRVLYCLIIAQLEMEERVVLVAAPMATEQRIRADEVDRASDPAPGALGHHQQNAVSHLSPTIE